MTPRPKRRRRFPRALLLVVLLLLLLPLAPVDWAGALRFFRGGDADGPGGGASEAARAGDGAAEQRFEWSAVLPRLAERAKAGQRAADEARVGESWRALATAVDSAAAAKDVGAARRALASARAGWLKEAPACAAAAEELAAELERAAEEQRRAELAAIEASLASGEIAAAHARLEALCATGDERAFEDAGRLAPRVRGAEPSLGAEERAREQALLWRRGSAGQPAEALLRKAISLALRAESEAEVVAALRLAHELARCAYPGRRAAEDLVGTGLELRWIGAGDPGAATLRTREGAFELRLPAVEIYTPLRTLEDPELAHLAVEIFAGLGLEPNDARSCLAAMLARSGERDTALRLLAVHPPLEDAERLRFVAALGG
ncbi:MAG: hypothetical protein JNM84_19520 [Planctomycetes bacterium]|nr:hypothetical protein [Planctomycetota bacterium]